MIDGDLYSLAFSFPAKLVRLSGLPLACGNRVATMRVMCFNLDLNGDVTVWLPYKGKQIQAGLLPPAAND